MDIEETLESFDNFAPESKRDEIELEILLGKLEDDQLKDIALKMLQSCGYEHENFQPHMENSRILQRKGLIEFISAMYFVSGVALPENFCEMIQSIEFGSRSEQ